MEIIPDTPLPMAEDFHSKNYFGVNSIGSRFLSQIDIESLTQSMESALKRVGQESRKKKKPRIFRYYMPSLEEIKEHDEESRQNPAVPDLTSVHKERAMNEGHYIRRRRRSRENIKQERN